MLFRSNIEFSELDDIGCETKTVNNGGGILERMVRDKNKALRRQRYR